LPEKINSLKLIPNNPIPMFTPQNLLVGLAVFYLALSLPALVSPKEFGKEAKKMLGDENNARLLSLFYFLLSFFFLSTHWRFEGEWMMLISMLGWLILLKALVYAWSPDYVKSRSKDFLGNETFITIGGILGIVAALALIYISYNFF